jgi:hypothetical protein
MAVTRATFVAQFPEFADTNTPQVEAVLAAAELEIDREVWGAKGDQGQMYLAAHKLALSPYGNAATMVLKKPNDGAHGDTVYGSHYDSLVSQVGSGWRVA